MVDTQNAERKPRSPRPDGISEGMNLEVPRVYGCSKSGQLGGEDGVIIADACR
jgi:hypothetical protein